MLSLLHAIFLIPSFAGSSFSSTYTHVLIISLSFLIRCFSNKTSHFNNCFLFFFLPLSPCFITLPTRPSLSNYFLFHLLHIDFLQFSPVSLPLSLFTLSINLVHICLFFLCRLLLLNVILLFPAFPCLFLPSIQNFFFSFAIIDDRTTFFPRWVNACIAH